MHLLFTGNYNAQYNRNLIIIEGLKKLGHTIDHFPFKRKPDLKEFATLEKRADAIYMPSFTEAEVKTVRKLSHKPLVFDPLISKYLTKVFDYKTISRFSPRALKNYFKDKRSCQLADLVLCDTQAHKDYFSKTFKISEDKFKVLYLGTPQDIFFPIKKEASKITRVGFYGAYAPLQGINKIIEAAKLLKDSPNIQFHIIGDGFESDNVNKLIKQYQLNNITLETKVPYNELNQKINSFDICLGIFGDSLKADLVIPNKIYHYLACQKPVISKDTTAIKEILEDKKHIILCKGDPKSIKEEILNLINDKEQAVFIAQNGHKLMQHYLDTDIAGQLIRYIEDIL